MLNRLSTGTHAIFSADAIVAYTRYVTCGGSGPASGLVFLVIQAVEVGCLASVQSPRIGLSPVAGP